MVLMKFILNRICVLKEKNKILFLKVLMALFFSTSFSLAAFDGNYIFQLEPATKAIIDSISIPKKGMMIYNTTDNKINYYDGILWIVLDTNIYNSNGKLPENRVVNLNTNTLTFINGNVGIGSTIPDATLDVNGSLRVDGIYYDKDGDTGTAAQILTSTSSGTDWTSTVLAPNISNGTINVAVSTTVTITLTGYNFIPTSTVTISGFNGTINSVNPVSPTEIQVNITTGSANTFDIVVSNNGILNTQWVGNGTSLLQVN